MPIRITHLLPLLLTLLTSGCASLPAAAETECGLSAAQVYERVREGVVSMNATTINPYNTADRVSRATGSGVIISAANRMVVTNAHVVAGAQHITVTVGDADAVPATLVGMDLIFDLAVVQLRDAASGRLTQLEFADSDNIHVGQDVLAIGNPLGLTQTLSGGVVSAINRILPIAPFVMSQPYIQTDAAINPGNSGGPLVDRCGKVVGINTATIAGAENIGFAIPSNLVTSIVPRLVADGRLVRPWLGFQGQFVNEDLTGFLNIPMTTGLLVEVVEPGGPAGKEGLRGGRLEISIDGHDVLLGGDIITHVNGRRIADPESLVRSLRSLSVGDRLNLRIFRFGETLSLSYDLPERPLLPSDIMGQASLPVEAHKLNQPGGND